MSCKVQSHAVLFDLLGEPDAGRRSARRSCYLYGIPGRTLTMDHRRMYLYRQGMNDIVRWPSVALLMGVLSTAVLAQAPGVLPPPALEKRLEEIDVHLSRLATYSLGSGIGAIGFRSHPQDAPDRTQWIQVDFGRPVPLDEIMLVPAIRRDAANGFQADGFPKALRLVAGIGTDREGREIAALGLRDELLPRIAPLVIPCQGTTATWIRIEAQMLSLRAFDARYVFQLSEILAFRGEENEALHTAVTSSVGTNPVTAIGWADAHVVDGFLPYLMAVPQGRQSVAYHSPRNFPGTPVLTIDLGARHPLSRLHLHAIDQSDTIPQAFAGDFGIPAALLIEGATAPDFSDARPLAEFRHETFYDVGPIMVRSFPATTCRYVRLGAAVDRPPDSPVQPLGFAEIELFAGGTNVALHQPVTANFDAEDRLRRLSNLTDGLNVYGSILPLREWLNQLARRHELERERPLVLAALNQHHARQKANLTRLVWLSILLALGVVVLAVVHRILRQRAIERVRNRLAADLHDELGADLHAIGLLSDLAAAARSSPGKLGDLLQRIRALTERSGKAARHCSNMLEAKGLYGDLAEDMRRSAERLLADLEHDIELADEAALQCLSPRKRLDLFLFYQECLVNIIRHSGATRVQIRLSATDRSIQLEVEDNGRGLLGAAPASLRRRARLLGAAVEAHAADGGGACIRLRVKPGRFGGF
jgi:signal transduction histidine kinase